MFNSVARGHWLKMVVRVMSSMFSCAGVVVRFDSSSTLHYALSTVSLIFSFILLIFICIFHMGRFGETFPCALPRMRSLTLWSTTPLSQELMVLLRKAQKITSVTCGRAHYGPRFVTAFLRPMFWSCVRRSQNGTRRNLLMNSQNYVFFRVREFQFLLGKICVAHSVTHSFTLLL